MLQPAHLNPAYSNDETDDEDKQSSERQGRRKSAVSAKSATELRKFVQTQARAQVLTIHSCGTGMSIVFPHHVSPFFLARNLKQIVIRIATYFQCFQIEHRRRDKASNCRKVRHPTGDLRVERVDDLKNRLLHLFSKLCPLEILPALFCNKEQTYLFDWTFNLGPDVCFRTRCLFSNRTCHHRSDVFSNSDEISQTRRLISVKASDLNEDVT